MIPVAQQLDLAATGGDDYQLCFTLPPKHWHHIAHLPVTVVGKITQGSTVTCFGRDGEQVTFTKSGYQHR